MDILVETDEAIKVLQIIGSVVDRWINKTKWKSHRFYYRIKEVYIMNKDYYNKWYQIEEFPNGPYEINKMGQIRNKRTKNILKPLVISNSCLLEFSSFSP